MPLEAVETYRFMRWMSSIRVVFSIDLRRTRDLGVRGETARAKGLKPRTALRIRLDVAGRVRTKMERVLRVASTTKASLGSRDTLVRLQAIPKKDDVAALIPAVVLQDGQHPVQ